MGDELLELVIREEDLVNRNVRASNLNNLRQRIVSKFLQLIRSPDHNPEIIRFEKVRKRYSFFECCKNVKLS